jgi:hypothetical protein
VRQHHLASRAVCQSLHDNVSRVVFSGLRTTLLDLIKPNDTLEQADAKSMRYSMSQLRVLSARRRGTTAF